jgi:hypothetical protein
MHANLIKATCMPISFTKLETCSEARWARGELRSFAGEATVVTLDTLRAMHEHMLAAYCAL